MKPTLLILAAGMGSRYGSLKQLDGVGPNGETIMDYSVFDAKRAGFGKVVFVIRESFAKEFEEKVTSKYKDNIDVELVFQNINDIPEGCTYNAAREKPWGTGHAVLAARNVIKEPFAVINADDFYGYDAFRVLADYLNKFADEKGKYSMVGYIVGNTLSATGSVSRGVCTVDDNQFLTSVVERTNIERKNGAIYYVDEHSLSVKITEDTLVSMNFWGFTPDFFDYSYKMFTEFVKNNQDNLTAEFYIPLAVNNLIEKNQASVYVLQTTAKWFGVTYKEDRQQTVLNINKLVNDGEYPNKLF